MLIERPLAASEMARANAPRGDMAFVTAVAAYGQKLRGDKNLGTYGWDEIRALTGKPSGYLREEFVKLTGIAASQSPGVANATPDALRGYRQASK